MRIHANKLAYIAGLMDGEGSIGIVRDHRGTFIVHVSISNTNRAVLRWVRQILRVGQVYERRHRNSLGKKPFYAWYCRNREAPEVLRRIRPWLRIKRKQADIVLEFTQFRRRAFARYRLHGWKRMPRTQHRLVVETRLYNRLKHLH